MIGHRVVLRPRSLVETADLAFTFVRVHWRLYLRLLPWVVTPFVPAWAAERFAGIDGRLTWSLALAWAVIGSGVYVRLCGELMLRPMADPASLQHAFLRQLPRWVMLRLGAGAITLISLTFAWPRAMLVPEAVLLEQAGLREAFARSAVLMRATPGRALGFGICAAGMAFAAAVGAAAAAEGVGGLFGFPPGSGPSLVSYLGCALTLPYLATLRFLLYIDCRTRREGWDLQVQMGALVRASDMSRGQHPPQEAA